MIVVIGVAAAPFVGFVLEAVSGGDGPFDGFWCPARSEGHAVAEECGFAVFEVVGDRMFRFYLI